MKNLINLLTSFILALSVAAVAILAVQNAAPVSVKFLVFQSIQIPVGVVLAFTAAIGTVIGSLFPFLWQLSGESNFSEDDTEEF